MSATAEAGPSQGKRRRKRAVASSDEDEPSPPRRQQTKQDAMPEFTDATRLEEMSRHYRLEAAHEGGSSISAREEEQLVRVVMRFMLFRQMQKPGVPVKRDELSKLIPKTYKAQKIHQLGRAIVLQAQAKFPAIFGMEMKEISSGAGEGPKMYVLRSLLKAEHRDLVQSKELQKSQAFIMTVLALILLAGGKLSEEDLTTHLQKVGLSPKSNHPALGKLPDLLQNLVQRKYLAEERQSGPEGPIKVFTVGACALDEIQEDNLKAFIDTVFRQPSGTRAN